MHSLLAHNYLPGADIARCDNSFTWPTEYACQIETFVPSSLNIIRELNDNDVGHCVAILLTNYKMKSNQYKFSALILKN